MLGALAARTLVTRDESTREELQWLPCVVRERSLCTEGRSTRRRFGPRRGRDELNRGALWWLPCVTQSFRPKRRRALHPHGAQGGTAWTVPVSVCGAAPCGAVCPTVAADVFVAGTSRCLCSEETSTSTGCLPNSFASPATPPTPDAPMRPPTTSPTPLARLPQRRTRCRRPRRRPRRLGCNAA